MVKRAVRWARRVPSGHARAPRRPRPARGAGRRRRQHRAGRGAGGRSCGRRDLVVLPEYVQYRGPRPASGRPPGPSPAPRRRRSRPWRATTARGSWPGATPRRPPIRIALQHGRAPRPGRRDRRDLSASSTCSTSRSTTDRPTRSPPGDAGRPGGRRRHRRDRARAVDLLRPPLPRAVPRPGAGGRGRARGAGGVHRAHRPRPLGGAAAGAGHRERRLGDRGSRLRHGGPGAIPAWGHSMVVDPWGRIVARRRRTKGSCGPSWTSTQSTRHDGRSRSSRTAGPTPCHRPGRSSAPPSSDRCPEGGREQATGPGLRRPTPSPPKPVRPDLAGHPWGRGASPIGVPRPDRSVSDPGAPRRSAPHAFGQSVTNQSATFQVGPAWVGLAKKLFSRGACRSTCLR